MDGETTRPPRRGCRCVVGGVAPFVGVPLRDVRSRELRKQGRLFPGVSRRDAPTAVRGQVDRPRVTPATVSGPDRHLPPTEPMDAYGTGDR